MTHSKFRKNICALPPLGCECWGLLGRRFAVQVVTGQSLDSTDALADHRHHFLFEDGQVQVLTLQQQNGFKSSYMLYDSEWFHGITVISTLPSSFPLKSIECDVHTWFSRNTILHIPCTSKSNTNSVLILELTENRAVAGWPHLIS